MTNLVSDKVRDLADSLADLKVRLRLALAGELAQLVAQAVGDVVRTLVAGRTAVGEFRPHRVSPAGREAALQPNVTPTRIDLIELLNLDDEGFRQRFRHTPIWRTKRAGMLRNAAIALGNHGDERALPALERALRDAEPTVREAATWAIERIRARERSHVESSCD